MTHDHTFLGLNFWLISRANLSVAISLKGLIVGMGFGRSRVFRHTTQILLTDYGTITIVVFTAFPHFGDELLSTQLLSLPTSPSFQTTRGEDG